MARNGAAPGSDECAHFRRQRYKLPTGLGRIESSGRTKGSAMTRSSIPPPGASVENLRAEAEHAAQRVVLYRRKVLLGRGDLRRLAELERVSSGAADRAKRAQAGR